MNYPHPPQCHVLQPPQQRDQNASQYRCRKQRRPDGQRCSKLVTDQDPRTESADRTRRQFADDGAHQSRCDRLFYPDGPQKQIPR